MSQTVSANVAAHLPEMARLQPETPAIFIPQGHDTRQQTSYAKYTFAELDRESDRMAAALAATGVKRGVRTVLMVPPGFEFFALTFALFKIGAVPVLVDPGMGVKNLKTCLAEAQPEAFIGIPKAHLARVFLGWGKPTVKNLLTVGKKFFWGGSTLDKILSRIPKDQQYQTAQTSDDETAAILLFFLPAAAPACQRALSTVTATSQRKWRCCARSTIFVPVKLTCRLFRSLLSLPRPWA
jgi:acyl-CoA synthetase (AMP-forming)/AMP-acid ligase II